MKFFWRSGLAALAVDVVAFAADIVVPSDTTNGVPDRIPVGDENFFCKEGAKLVRFTHVNLTRITGDSTWQEEQVGIGWGYPTGGSINTNGDWTAAQLLAFGKESAAAHLTTFGPWAFQEYPGSSYRLDMRWSPEEESKFYYASPFRYVVDFTPVQGAYGQWQAPAWVIDNMKMNFGDNVFMELPGVQRTRVRWWNGKKFEDSDPEYRPSAGLTSVGKTSSSSYSSIVALPTEPIIGKLSGILTMVFWDTITESEVIARYHTGTGSLLTGEQKEREPILLQIKYKTENADRPFVRLSLSPERDGNNITIERSSDFKSWSDFPYSGDWVDGYMFYRARYSTL